LLWKSRWNGEGLPEWYPLEVEEISVPYPQSYLNYIGSCDVVVLGWISQTLEFVNAPIPVVYWEQGHERLFGDCRDLSPDSPVRKHLRECYGQSGYYLTATSSTIAKILKARYGKEVMVLPNGIDTDFYHPVTVLMMELYFWLVILLCGSRV
jgi:glycosyltransferase involved in cell wall biosynthesis